MHSLRFSALALSAALLLGCGGPAQGARTASGELARNPSAQINDDHFAEAVREALLAPPKSRERNALLAGIESRQMARALQKFRSKTPQRGLNAVVGGLYMIRNGELAPNLFGPSGPDAMKLAARDLAMRGDEGRARALYEILLQVGPSNEKADVQAHLDAIALWMKSAVAHGGPVESAGAVEKVLVRRRLLEPTAQSLDDAANATIDWIKKALALRSTYRQSRTAPVREEATEAYRALQTGPAVLIALYLRDGDAAGALAALERAQIKEMLSPEVVRALQATADSPDSRNWLEMLGALRPLIGREGQHEEDDFAEERELFRAAFFSVAAETFRADPTVPMAAGALAAGLQELEMAEVSPAVLIDAAKAHSDARTVGGSLAVVMRAMSLEVEADDIGAVRRTFRAAQPLLALADKPDLVAQAEPNSARVRAMMADIELREGQIDAARPLLNAALKLEPSGHVLFTLARIEWRDKKNDAAIGYLKNALETEDAKRDHVLRGDILLTMSDLVREKGDTEGARKPLGDALREVLQARSTQDPDEKARAERVLAKILDRFGADKPAQRALERAFAAAPRDKEQASATLGQIVARGLVKADLPSARDGLTRAVAAELDDDDIVYLALWVRLLERQLKTPSDGVADRVFKSIRENGSWISKLALFGLGRLKGEDLRQAAKTPPQKVEAEFYAALERRLSGDTGKANEMLKQVVAGSGIQLMEVGLARDLLEGPRAQLGGPLPKDVNLP